MKSTANTCVQTTSLLTGRQADQVEREEEAWGGGREAEEAGGHRGGKVPAGGEEEGHSGSEDKAVSPDRPDQGFSC